MKIKIISIGNKVPSWIDAGMQEYLKRFPREYSINFINLSLAKRAKNIAIERCIEEEGQEILKVVGKDKDQKVIALDIIGKSWSTEELAEQVKKWQREGENINLLIGGPDGLSKACLEKAQIRWSLSPLTFPHTLVKLILVEQLYRAVSILTGHPYHRGG